MEQNTKIETFKTSLLANIWVERDIIVTFMITIIISVYVRGSLFVFFEVLLGIFLFTGIVFFGFVAIAAHIRYYFHFERHRKVELYVDRMIIILNNEETKQVLKNDIVKIILYDKRHLDGNLFPIFLDSFYYLTVIGKNNEKIVLTCLLDVKLKKKIVAWYGSELEHIYQFFPFPR